MHPPPGSAGLSNGVETENGVANAVSNIKQSKCPVTATVIHSAKRDGSSFMTYEQRIRAYMLVSEVFDLLVTDHDGCANMLMQDKSRVCISGNGEKTCYAKKSALFVEVTWYDGGKYFQPLVFRKKSYLDQLTLFMYFNYV
jgi:hypothetical protein